MEAPKQNKMKNCEVCKKDVHRSSFAKHLRSKTHQENEKIIPSNLFEEPKPSSSKKTIREVPSLKELSQKKLI